MSFQFSSVEPRIHHKKPELQLNVIRALHLHAVQTTPRLTSPRHSVQLHVYREQLHTAVELILKHSV